jgi:hypothetical protein
VKPPLSYSIASFKKTDFDDPREKIETLARSGFKVLTLIPTYHAETGNLRSARNVVRIHDGRTPSIDSIRAIAVAGMEAGMDIRFEPHIDTESSWRAYLVFDPLFAGGYYDIVLKPIFDLIVQIKDLAARPCFSLTLGSELETSIIEYSAQWEELLERFKQLRAGHVDLAQRLIFGHKINWDHFSPEWPQTPSRFSYLRKLDFISVSFYVPLAGNVPKEKWQQPPTDESIKEMADLMEHQWQNWLGPLEGLGPSIAIGEAGIGTTDASRPYDTSDPESMTTPEGRNVTRHYVRAIARFAEKHAARFQNRSNNPCMPFMPITFWTVNQCDWLGLRPEWRRFCIDDLTEIISGTGP